MSSCCSPASSSCSTPTQTSAAVQTAGESSPGAARRPGPIFHPQCDAYIAGEEAVIVADMPGCRAEGIDVTFDRGVLTIRGQAESRRPERGAESLLDEYAIGDYYRTFRIEFPVDAGAISASYAHGVLTVRVPKHEAARQRKVPVTAGAGR